MLPIQFKKIATLTLSTLLVSALMLAVPAVAQVKARRFHYRR